MSVVVVATVRPVPGRLRQVAAAYEAVVGDVHEEAGCELYALHEGEDYLLLLEKWTTAEALKDHAGSRTMKALRERIRNDVLGPTEVQTLTALPAGQLELGEL